MIFLQRRQILWTALYRQNQLRGNMAANRVIPLTHKGTRRSRAPRRGRFPSPTGIKQPASQPDARTRGECCYQPDCRCIVRPRPLCSQSSGKCTLKLVFMWKCRPTKVIVRDDDVMFCLEQKKKRRNSCMGTKFEKSEWKIIEIEKNTELTLKIKILSPRKIDGNIACSGKTWSIICALFYWKEKAHCGVAEWLRHLNGNQWWRRKEKNTWGRVRTCWRCYPTFPLLPLAMLHTSISYVKKTEEKKIGRKKLRQKWIVDEGENSCWEQVLQKMDT